MKGVAERDAIVAQQLRNSSIRAGSWQNGFFADFVFELPDFFRGFCRQIFVSTFLWQNN